MNLNPLFNPEQWLDMKVCDVLKAMGDANVGKLQLSANQADKAVFALVLIRGDETPELLQALDAKSDELSALATATGNGG